MCAIVARRGFTPMANETLDPGNQSEGDTKATTQTP